MDYILHEYVEKKKVPYEPIIKNAAELDGITFEHM